MVERGANCLGDAFHRVAAERLVQRVERFQPQRDDQPGLDNPDLRQGEVPRRAEQIPGGDLRAHVALLDEREEVGGVQAAYGQAEMFLNEPVEIWIGGQVGVPAKVHKGAHERSL